MVNIDMKDEYGALLTVTSEVSSFEDLNELFGTQADKTIIKGQPQLIGGKVAPDRFNEQDVWILDSRFHVSKYDALDKHIEFIVAILSRIPNSSRANFKSGDIEFSLTGYEYSLNPGVHLDSAVVELLSQFRADIDIDFFAVGE